MGKVSDAEVFSLTKRCRGRNFNERGCCSFENPCVEGEGDCEQDNDCNGDLVCGNNNCKAFGSFFHPKDDCCIKPMVTSVEAVTRPAFPNRAFPRSEMQWT